MRPSAKVLCLTFLALGAIHARADTVILKDGRMLQGDVVSESATTVKLTTSSGAQEFARDQVLEIQRGKSAREIFDARKLSAKSADDWFELANWAQSQKLKAAAKEAYKKTLTIDAQHAGANAALGNVQYKGIWMTPAARDQRAAADEEAEMLAKGMVRYEGRWVTKEDQAKLEQGLVLYAGRWIPKDDAMRAQGLESFDGQWLPRAEALARQDVRAAEQAAGAKFELALTDDCVVAGAFDVAVLSKIGAELGRARQQFDLAFDARPGLEWLGGRRAEFFCFGRDDRPYVDSVHYFGSLTKTVALTWAEATQKTQGFYWFDPYALSSARLGYRNDSDLVGHCLHHWGHLLLNRDGYDGRLLPPWYDESFACLLEFETLKSNAVFCRAQREAKVESGTTAKKVALTADFDSATFRRGAWRDALKAALAKNSIPPFEHLSGLEFNELGLIEIATGMAILAWVETQGAGALGRFHAEVRKGQPRGNARVDDDVNRRLARYDAAFQAAVGKRLLDADREWRAWVSSR